MATRPRLTQVASSDEAVLVSAIGFLRHEKSTAEQYALSLRAVEKTDPLVYGKGIELYMDSKGYFDELIEQLKVELIRGQNPAQSANFAALKQEAASERVKFSEFVKHEVIDKSQGARLGLPDVVNLVPTLLDGITDSVLKIYKAYRDNDREKRDLILNELTHLEWLSITELFKT